MAWLHQGSIWPFPQMSVSPLRPQSVSFGKPQTPVKCTVPSASCPTDARGLIRWMLMVNPDRRATIEDIANHWWVNWGYKSSVCDCDALHSAESPLLARIIDWHHRSTGLQAEAEAKIKGLAKPGAPEVMLERQRSLKKSKKENDFAQSGQDSVPESPSKVSSKRPKGIDQI